MSNVHTSVIDQVSVIRFARPEKKNALTLGMYTAFADALDAAAKDSKIRAVLVSGADGVFTAGNDIADFMQNPPNGEDSPVFRVLIALRNFEKPIVAAVDGPAVGIGTTMLLHCDFVVATTRAKFRLPFVDLALVPEGASSLLLPQVVGMQRASEWLLLAEPFDAAEAREAGLVNRVVAPEALDAEAMKFAEALAKKPPEAMRLAKKLLRDPLRASVSDAMTREGAMFIERLQSPEAMEAFMAFASRKKG